MVKQILAIILATSNTFAASGFLFLSVFNHRLIVVLLVIVVVAVGVVT